jgi:AraC-like DNA-binding protein
VAGRPSISDTPENKTDRPGLHSDALSEVLRAVRLSGGMFFRVRLRAPYAVTSLDAETMLATFAPGADHILPFHLVTKGPMWFEIVGDEAVLLEKGDIIVLPHGAEHSLSDRPGSHPVSVKTLQEHVSGHPPTLDWGGDGHEGRALCGFFHCHGRLFNPLMDSLPQVVVIRQDPDRSPWLVATLERTFDETLEERPGGAALIERLTGLLFMEVVQRYLEQNAAAGWLAGLSDPVVGKVLQLIHRRPARSWTVEELAKRAGASRTVLSDRFRDTVGMSPIRYLTAWRMELGAARILESNDTLAEIASDVGYDSEASFSRAFKRHVGESPAAWRRGRKAAAKPPVGV